MLTEALFAIATYGWFVLGAGAIMLVVGIVAVALRRYPDPPIPQVQTFQPAPIVPAQPVEPNYHRVDTHVMPEIPGASPPPIHEAASAVIDTLDAAIEHTEAVTQALTTVHGLRDAIADRPASEVLRNLSTLRGPVCPTCGGPWGNCSCSSKSGANGSPFNPGPVDECELTTGEIEIPTEGDPPIAAQAAAFRLTRQETRDLTVRLDQIKERAA